MDEDVTKLIMHIQRIVQENGEKCTELLNTFADYDLLWKKDTVQMFEQFLHGRANSSLSTTHQKSVALNSTVTMNPSTLRRIASARTHSRSDQRLCRSLSLFFSSGFG